MAARVDDEMIHDYQYVPEDFMKLSQHSRNHRHFSPCLSRGFRCARKTSFDYPRLCNHAPCSF